ncbi:MAG TPA: hypothetical protein VK178_17895, partial [Opitutaceae bacterium]|nr:hypothetical protein [Opitutaceae bacterium]
MPSTRSKTCFCASTSTAWELPEFPDAWLEYAQYYDEIWCPSDFVREAIAAKLPHAVHTMPHAIGFA